LLEGALECERCQHATSGVIFMGNRGTKQRHKPIAQKLIDSPFVAMDPVECNLEKAIEERMHCFRSNALSNRGRVRQVTEQHCHLFPFTFERTPGGQNFLGKVFWGVGQGFALVVEGWRSSRS